MAVWAKEDAVGRVGIRNAATAMSKDDDNFERTKRRFVMRELCLRKVIMNRVGLPQRLRPASFLQFLNAALFQSHGLVKCRAKAFIRSG